MRALLHWGRCIYIAVCRGRSGDRLEDVAVVVWLCGGVGLTYAGLLLGFGVFWEGEG